MCGRCAAILLFQGSKGSHLNGNRVYPLAHVGENLASFSASLRQVWSTIGQFRVDSHHHQYRKWHTTVCGRCVAILLFQGPKRSHLNGDRVYPLAHVGGN